MTNQSNLFEVLNMLEFPAISTRYFVAGEKAGWQLKHLGYQIETVQGDPRFQTAEQPSLWHEETIVQSPDGDEPMSFEKFAGALVMNMDSNHFPDWPTSDRVCVRPFIRGIQSGLEGQNKTEAIRMKNRKMGQIATFNT